MSKINQRLHQLRKLRDELKNGSQTRKLTIYSYLQLLDYHIALVKEVDDLVNAIQNDDKEYVEKWYKYRVSNETQKLEE